MAYFLKRLELGGFKSFAQKTVLEFPSGITAIVGPNGSGKSNIIDAVRWLLGEREARNLRGTKVEDLIFAGTPKRARMGQAHAGLFFDNHGKFFPVDFSEVAVVRQVNRNGLSNYFLNKSEVRLKDIVDFFARARLGARGLVVIGQGNSDIFIEATPANRQAMIEEILGLREYQLKKEEAERRLKNTSINLDKAKTLIDEIVPHLRSLKRQTGRWEKRDILQQKLRALEDTYFGTRFASLARQHSAVEQDIAKREKGKIELMSARKKAEENLSAIEAQQPKERANLTEIKKKIQSLLDLRGTLQKDIGRLEAQVELGTGSALSASPRVEELISLLKKIKNTLEDSAGKEDVFEMRSMIADLLEEVDHALEAVSDEDSEAAVSPALAKGLQKLNADLKTLENELEQLKKDEATLEKSQESFYKSFKLGVSAVEAAKDAIDAWESASQKLLFEKERLHIHRKELDHQAFQAGRKSDEFSPFSQKTQPTEAELGNIEKHMFKFRGDLAAIGEVDEAIMKEAQETETRYEFLAGQIADLSKAVADLHALIDNLSEKIKEEFDAALGKINKEFDKFFNTMFNGGRAKLKVAKKVVPQKASAEDEENSAGAVEAEDNASKEEVGLEIDVRLPRKRINSLEMLSGGERSLVGIAALFALISVSPPPFLVLDEIDAALDERNARRFAEMLKDFSHTIQFIVVTHNRATMEVAEVLYGVTMDADGTSQVVSLKFEEGAEKVSVLPLKR